MVFKLIKKLTIASAVTLCVGMGNASAQSYKFNFPGTTGSDQTSFYSLTNLFGSLTPGGTTGFITTGGGSYYMWHAGDYITEHVNLGSKAYITSFTDQLKVINNLGSGQSEQVEAIISVLDANGKTENYNIGSWTINGAGFSGETDTINFNSDSFNKILANKSFDIKFELTKTLASYEGSIMFLDGGVGQFNTSPIPEPEEYLMLLTGLLAIMGYKRVKPEFLSA